VTARSQPKNNSRYSQTGIALLQVLLISAVISLLAIRFTITARDQLEMSARIDERVRAQLKALSTINEVIFLNLSESVSVTSDSYSNVELSLPPVASLNRYGAPIKWSDDVEVVIQDLNGLLPQIFVDHPLWKVLLMRSGMSQEVVDRYIGIWSDIQDKDLVSWDLGEEPSKLSTGGLFINGYAQNDKVLKWVFSDQPEVLNVFLKVSDINASFETNMLNAPKELLNALLDKQAAETILSSRALVGLKAGELETLLPDDYKTETIYTHNSNKIKVNVRVKLLDSVWEQSQTISFYASSAPPYKVLLKK